MNNPNCGRCGMLNHAGFCQLTACIYPCSTGMGGYINKPLTNADRIRAMSDEELAKMIIKYAVDHNVDICPETRSNTDCAKQETCVDCWIDWLQQEVTD